MGQQKLNRNTSLDDILEGAHEKGIGSVVSHLVIEGTIDLEYMLRIQRDGSASGHYEDLFKIMHGQNSRLHL